METNKTIQDILNEINNKFKKFIFEPRTHTFKYIDEHGSLKPMAVSVTSLVYKYTHPFDKQYWATKKAIERGVPTEVILKEWDEANKKSILRGSVVHAYIEEVLSNKKPTAPIIKEDKEVVDNFLNEIKEVMIPIKSEIVIGDVEYGVAGIIDQLFYNKKKNSLVIVDWKTNKKIDLTNHYQKMLPPLNNIDDCNYNHYSLQVALYKFILEKNTSLKIDNTYIIHFDAKDNKPKIRKTRTFDKKVLIEIMRSI